MIILTLNGRCMIKIPDDIFALAHFLGLFNLKLLNLPPSMRLIIEGLRAEFWYGVSDVY